MSISWVKNGPLKEYDKEATRENREVEMVRGKVSVSLVQRSRIRSVEPDCLSEACFYCLYYVHDKGNLLNFSMWVSSSGRRR